MIEDEQYSVLFPSLDYLHPRDGHSSCAQVAYLRVPIYAPGKYLTDIGSNEMIKDVLREHKVSMSGRKEQLVEKLAKLSVKVYEKYKAELDVYFRQHRFIRVTGTEPRGSKPFPVLNDLDLGPMVLTMYVLKHLRGNSVLEADYENETFDLIDLARSLIKREVSLEGGFMQVE